MSTLELVMIVRDEARALERCLASARAWVDGIVVVDTGSIDATVEIARRHGARVAHFAWIDDFAAARNAALAASDADWRLVLDGDEWIAEGGESLAGLRSEPPGFIGQVRVRSSFDAAGGRVEQAPSWLPRVLPRGVLYQGRIHEQPQSLLPRRRLSLVVGHDGYLDVQKAAKAGRNERLLRLALDADPEDAYLHYQLGKDLELGGRFGEAEPHYGQALERCDLRAGWRHDLVLRALFSLKKLRRFEAAIGLAEAEMPRWPDSPDFYFTLGDLLLEWAASEPARGVELLPMIESSWLRALEIGERPDLQDTVRGRGSFLAAHNLAVLHASLGADAEAARWRERETALRAAA
jgi:glycosyltransferase involved in cell wall biosynthesis